MIKLLTTMLTVHYAASLEPYDAHDRLRHLVLDSIGANPEVTVDGHQLANSIFNSRHVFGNGRHAVFTIDSNGVPRVAYSSNCPDAIAQVSLYPVGADAFTPRPADVRLAASFVQNEQDALTYAARVIVSTGWTMSENETQYWRKIANSEIQAPFNITERITEMVGIFGNNMTTFTGNTHSAVLAADSYS